MKQKIKLSLLDDYVVLYKTLAFCNSVQEASEVSCNDEILKLKTNCQNLLKTYNNLFANLKLNDASFLLFKAQLDEGLNQFRVPIFNKIDDEINNYLTKLNVLQRNLPNKLKLLP